MQKWWSYLFAGVNLAALGLFVVAPFIGWWLPKDVSTFGWEVDMLFYAILAVTGLLFALTEGVMVYAMYCWAGQPGQQSAYVHGNHKLEVYWTVVPAIILLVLAFAQIRTWEHIKYQSHMPDPTDLIEVSARQFEWRIRYPSANTLKDLTSAWRTKPQLARSWDEQPHSDDIRVVNELHVWQSTEKEPCRVRVYLKTRDVLHSFFLPNLRLKQDALPGRTLPVWFEAKEHNIEWDEAKKDWKISENWELACAELCGWGHYKMQGRLFVHKDKDDYERWLKQAETLQNQRELAQVERGK